ncbi:MAG: hypothetical protein QOF07_2753 [Bradyrhizobium sp.]|nr:hypothetical protein [Bradyrhizobium sp.]
MGGDTLITLALAGSLFFDISPHAARGRVALSLVLTMAPFAVVAPFLGPAIDRTRGGLRLMVFLSAVGRALMCVLMAGVIHGLLVFPYAFGALVLSKAYAVSKCALVPAAVDDHSELVEANSKLAIISGVVGLLAAIPGIAILQLIGAGALLRVAAVVFAAAAVAALRIANVEPSPVPEPAGSEAEPPVPLALVPSQPVRLAAAAMGTLRVEVGFLTFLIAFSFRRAHAPSWWFGLALGASVVGGLLGAAVAPRLRGRVEEHRIILVALGFVAVMAVLSARLGARPGATLLALAVGVAGSAGKLSFDSIVQREVPAPSQGRSFARFEAGFQLVWVAGALLPVLLPIPERVGLFLLGAGAAVAAVAYWSGRRRLPT